MELDILKPRHSLAHILAQAVQQTIDPHVALGTGPAVDNGFYYDMLFSEGIEFGEDSLKDLTKTMQGIVKHNQAFVLYTAKGKDEALHILSLLEGKSNSSRFKKELVEKFSAAGEANYTFYFNTIPNAAAEKLLSHTRPEYKEAYQNLTLYIISQGGIDPTAFITFSDLCE
ncbi:hypothetical protein KA478_00560 [Patescibacteria group bacterium]|nr:hypothetical protein [Patescibacteria group bacterium]